MMASKKLSTRRKWTRRKRTIYAAISGESQMTDAVFFVPVAHGL